MQKTLRCVNLARKISANPTWLDRNRQTWCPYFFAYKAINESALQLYPQNTHQRKAVRSYAYEFMDIFQPGFGMAKSPEQIDQIWKLMLGLLSMKAKQRKQILDDCPTYMLGDNFDHYCQTIKKVYCL